MTTTSFAIDTKEPCFDALLETLDQTVTANPDVNTYLMGSRKPHIAIAHVTGLTQALADKLATAIDRVSTYNARELVGVCYY